MQILFVSLGCDKNLVDTEMMLGQLAEKGYTFTDDEAEADIAVVTPASQAKRFCQRSLSWGSPLIRDPAKRPLSASR